MLQSAIGYVHRLTETAYYIFYDPDASTTRTIHHECSHIIFDHVPVCTREEIDAFLQAGAAAGRVPPMFRRANRFALPMELDAEGFGLAMTAYATARGINLITLHCLFWLLANLTIPGSHRYLFYNRYSSHPLRLFLTWLVLSVAIIYTASLYLWSGIMSLGSRYQARVRAMALSTSIIAGGTILYGAVVLVQVVAGAAGVDSATATHITAPIISAMAVVALVSTSVMLFARRGWNYLQELVSVRLQRELMELESERQLRIYHRNVHLSTWINERLLRVRQDYSAADAVEYVSKECKRLKLPLERCLMAREAVRFITLNFENVMETPFYDEDELEERRGMAEYFILQMGDGSFYYDHVFKIAALAVGPADLLEDITMPGEIEPWHRELAAIVADGLRHSRPERMTDAS